MMENAIALYELMAERLSKTGMSPFQAQVYAEIAEFMRSECATLEEATEKIKNSRFYLAPSVALLKDKINAFIRAAEDDEIEGAAEVYRKKLAEIECDPSAMHDPAYLTSAHNIFIKHFERIYAFQEIYMRYLEVEACNDEHLFDSDCQALSSAFGKLESYGGNFPICSAQHKFREQIPVSDEAYQRFVHDAILYFYNPPHPAKALREAEKRVSAIWSDFSRDEIEKKMSSVRSAVGACLMVAPQDESGEYDYKFIINH